MIEVTQYGFEVAARAPQAEASSWLDLKDDDVQDAMVEAFNREVRRITKNKALRFYIGVSGDANPVAALTDHSRENVFSVYFSVYESDDLPGRLCITCSMYELQDCRVTVDPSPTLVIAAIAPLMQRVFSEERNAYKIKEIIGKANFVKAVLNA